MLGQQNQEKLTIRFHQSKRVLKDCEGTKLKAESFMCTILAEEKAMQTL